MVGGQLNGMSLKGDVNVYLAPSAVVSQPVTDQQREREPTQWLTCLHCNQKIAKASDRIEVNAKHEHTFVNPMGVIYHIGCFAAAPGVLEIGAASDDFAWFVGHAWRIALCRGCDRHLGWTFAGAGTHFAGLVLNQLTLHPQ